MIVHSLHAENFLKYRSLQLDDLPERGVTAISGRNESGKSTIGETLCFALFGRTFAVAGEAPEKLVRWGEDRCSVRVVLGREGERYEITRMLDRDGNHSARLTRADAPDHPLARGVEAVAEALAGMLGYEYEEFVESFYLAQREIVTPHPHSYSVKVMAGVAPLERARGEFAEEIGNERAGIAAAEGKAADVEAQLAALGFDGERLQGLEAQRADLERQGGWIGERREALNGAAIEYREREPRLREAEGGRRAAAVLGWLFLLLAALALGPWALLTRLPEAAVSRRVAGLLEAVPGWQAGYLDWMLFGGIALAVLGLLFWLRVASLRKRIGDLYGAAGRLAHELAILDEMDSALSPGLTSVPEPAADTDAEPVMATEPALRTHLIQRIEAGDAGADEVRQAAERETAWLDRAGLQAQRGITDTDREIAGERVRQAEHDKLAGMRDAFTQQADEHRGRIRVRELADELLLGATRHLSHRFNHNLRGLVGKTLPLFTEGRYEHLQIDEDLTVRAFSSEKRDFMDLDEISSGTQRQIMLALRLALSQELVNRVVKGAQFLFLDEPFAFFDETRTRSALQELPRLSDEITQIWVVAQEFPEDVAFDRGILCARENESLTFA